MKLFKRTLAGLLLLLFFLVAGLLANTASRRSMQPAVQGSAVDVDTDAVAGRLAELLRLRTVSDHDPAAMDPEPFLAVHELLEQRYPHAHAAMRRELVNELSLLYTWQGSDPSLPPVLLLAHMDVVPVEPGTASRWSQPPFGGVIADGYVWGRGAIDMKAAIVGIFEAAEALAAQGWRPPRTVIIALGHDEEVGGHAGQEQIRDLLVQRGVKPVWVLDEGLVIVQDIIPGLDGPAGLIGVAEKGYLSLELVVQGTGGHSSMPPPQTAAGIVAAAVARLEADPFPGELSGPTAEMFAWLAPEMVGPLRLAMSNLWLFEPVVRGQLAAQPNTNATLGTTTAVTQLQGSVQDNVLPQEARAVVNLRLHPRDSIESAITRVQAVIDDPRVQVRPLTTSLYSQPSPVSPTDGPGFQAIARALRQADPQVVVAPGLMIGGTDSRFYLDVADAVYRFHPFWAHPGDTDRIHGTDERIAVDNLATYVRFYRSLLEGLAG